jgi:hypothetical protein
MVGVMIAFEVFVNGERVCTAATRGVLTAILTWTWRQEEDTSLTVGGISEPDAGARHVEWPTPWPLKVGDEVTVRIVSTDEFDTPRNRLSLS